MLKEWNAVKLDFELGNWRGMDMRLGNEAHALIRCANLHLDEYDADYIQSLFGRRDFDWERFWKLANIHKICNILYSHLYLQKTLQPDTIPSKYRNILKHIYLLTHARNKIMFKEIDNIATRFAEENITVVFLKGPVLCEKLYHNLGLRSFGDLDILVHQENVDIAKQILRDMGYVSEREFAPDHASVPEELWPGHPHEEPMLKRSNNSLVPVYAVEVHRFYPYYGVDV